jgi:hypothetical protein
VTGTLTAVNTSDNPQTFTRGSLPSYFTNPGIMSIQPGGRACHNPVRNRGRSNPFCVCRHFVGYPCQQRLSPEVTGRCPGRERSVVWSAAGPREQSARRIAGQALDTQRGSSRKRKSVWAARIQDHRPGHHLRPASPVTPGTPKNSNRSSNDSFSTAFQAALMNYRYAEWTTIAIGEMRMPGRCPRCRSTRSANQSSGHGRIE